MERGEQRSGYELLRRLASGGMGEVFVARKTGAADFEKHVALKLLLPHLTASPESVKRFYAEARLAARMHHPNIVEIFDVGEAEGRPFIAMQLVEGFSLGQYLRIVAERQLTVPLPVVRAIATSVCEALTYAHGLKDAKGRPLKLVHRDVTPSNVLLSFTGGVQLTDFGIARIGDGHTRAGVLQGKASYVAPEQLTHEVPVDTRADLYSLAVTLYELITGENPLRRDSQDETFAAVLLGKVRPVRQVRPDVSVQMEAALQQAMARKPEARFADATSFRKAFVDGPAASGPDLAEHFKLVAASWRASPAEEEPASTRSQVLRVTHSVSAEVTPSPARRTAPLVALSALVVVGAITLIGVLSRDRRATDAAAHGPNEGAATAALVTPADPRVTADPPLTDPPGGDPPVAADPPPTAGPPVAAGPRLAADPPVADPPVAADPLAPAVIAREPSPTRAPLPPKPKAAPPSKPPAGLRVGYLAADAEPWADVMVDGARVDRTPFSKYPLPIGRHEVTFQAPDGRRQVKAITIAEGATTSIRADFPQK